MIHSCTRLIVWKQPFSRIPELASAFGRPHNCFTRPRAWVVSRMDFLRTLAVMRLAGRSSLPSTRASFDEWTRSPSLELWWSLWRRRSLSSRLPLLLCQENSSSNNCKCHTTTVYHMRLKVRLRNWALLAFLPVTKVCCTGIFPTQYWNSVFTMFSSDSLWINVTPKINLLNHHQALDKISLLQRSLEG